jgi:hypothetical protein
MGGDGGAPQSREKATVIVEASAVTITAAPSGSSLSTIQLGD